MMELLTCPNIPLAFWYFHLFRCTRTAQKKNDCSHLVFRKIPDTIHFIANILGPILYMMREMTFERKLWGQIEKNQMTEIDRKDSCCNHTWIFFSNDQLF